MSTTTTGLASERRRPSDSTYDRDAGSQKAGGVAALDVTLALLAAIPYFLLWDRLRAAATPVKEPEEAAP